MQFFAEGPAFADAMTVQQLTAHIPLLGALTQLIETTPLGSQRTHTRQDDQTTRHAATQRKPVAGQPGVMCPGCPVDT